MLLAPAQLVRADGGHVPGDLHPVCSSVRHLQPHFMRKVPLEGCGDGLACVLAALGEHLLHAHQRNQEGWHALRLHEPKQMRALRVEAIAGSHCQHKHVGHLCCIQDSQWMSGARVNEQPRFRCRQPIAGEHRDQSG